MNEREERAYVRGTRAAAQSMLSALMRELDPKQRKAAALFLELEATRAALRSLCEHIGGVDDWGDDEHLADVVRRIEKAVR